LATVRLASVVQLAPDGLEQLLDLLVTHVGLLLAPVPLLGVLVALGHKSRDDDSNLA